MKTHLILQKPKHFLLLMLFLQLIFNVVVIVDLSLARQTIGFFYLIFIPGFLTLKLLKINRIDFVETILYSTGFSIAIVMLIGLLLNIFCHALGLPQPLSIFPTLLAINVFALISSIVIYYNGEFIELFDERFSKKFLGLILLSIFPLILSIAGAMLVNLSGNNFILLLMILKISSLVIVGLVLGEKFAKRVYALLVFIISLSLLYHSSLVSNYIVGFGSDSHVEHCIFQNTLNNAYWNLTNPFEGSLGFGRMHSMLSITILPTIYSTILNMDSSWVFKIIYPIIFSVVPLCLFWTWKNYIGEKRAFASAFLFVAQETFYTELLGLNRQMIAELFFVLLIFIILNRTVKPVHRVLFFTIFGFGLVVSHYALAEIFLFFISAGLISFFVFRKNSQCLTASMVILFFVIMFTWYLYTSGASVFSSILEFGDYVCRQLSDFFNPASRGESVLRGLGLEPPPTVWNAISRGFAYITEALIIVGFIGLITKRAKASYCREYYTFTLIAMGFLWALIVVPGLAETLNMTRFYHVLLFFLAPLCIMGAELIVEIIFKKKKSFLAFALLISVLIPYFLFQTSFVYEVVGSQSWSLPLSMHRLGIRLHAGYAFVTNQEVYGSRWLSQYINVKRVVLFADFHIFSALVGYGGFVNINTLTNVTQPEEDAFIYFGKLNTVYGLIIDYDAWNTTKVLETNFKYLNKIYSNGECEIYKVVNP